MSPKKSRSSSRIDPSSSGSVGNGNIHGIQIDNANPFQQQGGYYEGYVIPHDSSNINILNKSNMTLIQGPSQVQGQPSSDIRTQQMISLPSPNAYPGMKLGFPSSNNSTFSKVNAGQGYLHNSQCDQSPLVLSPGNNNNGGTMTTFVNPATLIKQKEGNISNLQNHFHTIQEGIPSHHDVNNAHQLNQQAQNLQQAALYGINTPSSAPGPYFLPMNDATLRTSSSVNKTANKMTSNSNTIAQLGGPFYHGLPTSVGLDHETSSRSTLGGNHLPTREILQGQIPQSQQQLVIQSKSSPNPNMNNGGNPNLHQNAKTFYLDPFTGRTAFAVGQYQQGHSLIKAPSSTIHSAYNGANDIEGNSNTISANSQSAANTSASISQPQLQTYSTPASLTMPFSNGNHHSTGMTSDITSATIAKNPKDLLSNSRNIETTVVPNSLTHHTQNAQQNNHTQSNNSDAMSVATNSSLTLSGVDINRKDSSPALTANTAHLRPSFSKMQNMPTMSIHGSIPQNPPLANISSATLQPSMLVKNRSDVVPGNTRHVGGTNMPSDLPVTNVGSRASINAPQNYSLRSPKDQSLTKRRQDRNAREQKRSMRISQQINNLKEILENDGRRTKNSKIAILMAAEQYIRDLEKQAGDLDERLRQVYKETGYPIDKQNNSQGVSHYKDGLQQKPYQIEENNQNWNMNNNRNNDGVSIKGQQEMNENGEVTEKKTSAYAGQVVGRYNSNDGYFTDSESEDDDFENEYDFRQTQHSNRPQGIEKQVENDKKNIKRNGYQEYPEENDNEKMVQNVGGLLSQTRSQSQSMCQSDQVTSSDSVSATHSLSLPSRMEKMHMHNSVSSSSPKSESMIETSQKETGSICESNPFTNSSKRRRYDSEEKSKDIDPNKDTAECSSVVGQNSTVAVHDKCLVRTKKRRESNHVVYIHQDFALADHNIAFAYNFVALAIASEEGQFLDANKAFEELSGYRKDELLKLTFFNLIRSDQLDESFNIVACLLLPKTMTESVAGSNDETIVFDEDVNDKSEDKMTEEFEEEHSNSQNTSNNEVTEDIKNKSDSMNRIQCEQVQGGIAKVSFYALPKSLTESKYTVPDDKRSKDRLPNNEMQLTISVGPSANGTSKVFYCSLTNQKIG